MSRPPETIDCIECGGTCHLISYLPDEEDYYEGYPVAYRCADCMDRFDLVWIDDDSNGED